MKTQIIIDAGGTKTQFAVLQDQQLQSVQRFPGFHVLHHSIDQLKDILIQAVSNQNLNNVGSIHYYGTGVLTQKSADSIRNCLLGILKCAESDIHIKNDIVGAARALFGKAQGLGAILGTGAVCFETINGEILRKSPSLGYLLGDCGSGYHLGKLFLQAYIHGRLEQNIERLFEENHHLTRSRLIGELYNPNTNQQAYIAQFAKFVKQHLDASSALQEVTRKNFKDWVILQILPFASNWRSIALTGSIAITFKSYIFEILNEYGLSIDKIVKEPMEDLIHFHLNDTFNSKAL